MDWGSPSIKTDIHVQMFLGEKSGLEYSVESYTPLGMGDGLSNFATRRR
jgi:hypothetical protein